MYALKPKSYPQPAKPLRVVPKANVRPKRSSHRAIACEVTAKLAVNVVLSTTAVMALVHLFPHRTFQAARLQELQVAVQSTGMRVQHVQARFSRYFDPSQTRLLMQENSNRIDPLRRQIVWRTSSPATAQPDEATTTLAAD